MTLILSGLLTGCSRSFDAYFTNPCEHSIELDTYTASPETVENLEPYKSAELPALETTLIEDAFAGGKGAYSVDGGEAVELDPDLLVNDTVVVPARFC